MYRLELNHRSQRFFDDAEASLQRRLDRCWRQLAADPHHHPNVKRLSGSLAGLFRYRVGDYRVIYRIDEPAQRVDVVAIANRKDVYE
jgi:mRNA interferase RelE/StbE